SYPAYKAFDYVSNSTNRYASGNPTYDSVSSLYINSITTIVDGITYYGEWLQIQMPAAIVLTNYTIYGVPNTNSLHVRDLILCASNDGSTWTFVDQKSQLVWPYADPTFRNFSVTRPLIKPYTYYRFICRAITSGTYWDVVELQLFAGNVAYVDTWYDQSGNGFHATQTTLASQPSFDYGQGLIDFRVANSFLNMGSASSGPIPSGDSSYTYVFKHGIWPGQNNNTLFSGGSASVKAMSGIANSAGTYTDNWYAAGDYNFGTVAPGNTAVSKYDGTTRSGYVNGVAAATATISGHVTTAGVQQYIGRRVDGYYFNGQAYYIQIYNTALSDADRFQATISTSGCGSQQTTALTGFQYPRDANPEVNPAYYPGFSSGLFSSQAGTANKHILGGSQ